MLNSYLNKFFFFEVSNRNQALFRIIFYFLNFLNFYLLYLPLPSILNDLPEENHLFFNLFSLVAVSDTTYLILKFVFALTLLTSSLGLLNRLSRLICAVCGFYIFGYKYNFLQLSAVEGVYIIGLLMMSLAPLGESISLDKIIAKKILKKPLSELPSYNWNLSLLRFYFVFLMLSAGYVKLKVNPNDWLNENMPIRILYFIDSEFSYLKRPFIFQDCYSYLRNIILTKNWIGQSMTRFITLTEIFMPFICLFKKIRYVFIILIMTGLLFVYLMTGIRFFFLLLPITIAWLSFEKKIYLFN